MYVLSFCIFESNYKNFFIIRPKIDDSNFTETSSLIFTQSQNSSAKTAIVVQDCAMYKFESIYQRSLNWMVLPNYVLQAIHISFATTANNFFFQILDKTARQLTETGIIQQLVSNSYGRKFLKVIENHPVVLKVSDLSFGFVIFVTFLGASVLVFACEILIYFLKVRMNNLEQWKFNFFSLLSLRWYFDNFL